MNQTMLLAEMQKQTTLMVTEDFLLTHVMGIQDEIKRNMWPDNTRLSRMFTVGEVRAIPNWETDAAVVSELVAALVGRSVRAIAVAVDPHQTVDLVKVLPILDSVQLVEARAIKRLIAQ